MSTGPIDLTLELQPPEQPAGQVRWTNSCCAYLLRGQKPKSAGDGNNVAAEGPCSLSYARSNPRRSTIRTLCGGHACLGEQRAEPIRSNVHPGAVRLRPRTADRGRH